MQYPLHRLNTEFEWTSPSSAPTTLTQDQCNAFDRDGFFIYRDAFTADELSSVRASIDPIEERLVEFLRTQDEDQLFISKADTITFSIHLVKQSETLKAFSRHPVLAGIARDLLGENVRLYWDQSVYKKPGNPEDFPYHQDNGYTFIEPQIYLTCWIPLLDVDERNGCPWVVPGLHKLGTLRHESTPLGFQCLRSHAEEIATPARAGDIVVFSSLTPHKTGPNLSDETRKAYILQYAPDGCRRRVSKREAGDSQDDPARQYFVVKEGRRVEQD